MNDDRLAVSRLGIMAALGQGDVALAFQLVLGLMDDGCSMPMIVEEVLVPIQRESGRHWETGDATIAEEHLSTAAIEALVAMLAGAFDQPADAGVVVVVCATGDTHSLPARMASALLAYEGYRTLFLATSVPPEDLDEYLPSAGADSLVVSCARAANLLGARACIAAGHRAAIPVVVGGHAFDGGRRWELLGADAYAPSLRLLADVLKDSQFDPDSAERRAKATGPDVDALVVNRDKLVAVVVDSTTARANVAVDHPRFHEAAEELVDTLAGALHVDDPELLAQHARWLSDLLERQTGLAVTYDHLLETLAAAARAVTPAGERFIAHARTLARSIVAPP